MKIDINCDMGESFGTYKLGIDEKVIQYITSANIACGWHAGDPLVMDKTVKMAAETFRATSCNSAPLASNGSRVRRRRPITSLRQHTYYLRLTQCLPLRGRDCQISPRIAKSCWKTITTRSTPTDNTDCARSSSCVTGLRSSSATC